MQRTNRRDIFASNCDTNVYLTRCWLISYLQHISLWKTVLWWQPITLYQNQLRRRFTFNTGSKLDLKMRIPCQAWVRAPLWAPTFAWATLIARYSLLLYVVSKLIQWVQLHPS